MSNIDELSKNWKGFLAGMALAASPAAAQSTEPPNTDHKTQKLDLSTVLPELVPISHLESSGGSNLNHKPGPGGEFDSATGHLGFKPKTGYDTYKNSQHLQTLFPDLHDQAKFLQEMKSNPNFYNSLAATHWGSLKGAFKTLGKAAYAWRHGRGAAFKATPEQVDSDPYVKKYNEILGGTNKSERDLTKSEKLEEPRKVIEKLSGTRSGRVYNYDHLLTPMQIAEGYSVRLNDSDSKWQASLNHNGLPVGSVQAQHNSASPLLQDKLSVGDAFINGPDDMSGHPGHRGLGLGQALYESLYAHANKKGNIKHVIGGIYSAMSEGVHRRLADKHGMGFIPHPVQNLSPSAYDMSQGLKYVTPTEHDSKYTNLAMSEKPFKKKLSLTERIHLKLSEESTKKNDANGDYTGWLNSVIQSSFA
jgi:GNAT superfamily N-acetyltransferase